MYTNRTHLPPLPYPCVKFHPEPFQRGDEVDSTPILANNYTPTDLRDSPPHQRSLVLASYRDRLPNNYPSESSSDTSDTLDTPSDLSDTSPPLGENTTQNIDFTLRTPAIFPSQIQYTQSHTQQQTQRAMTTNPSFQNFPFLAADPDVEDDPEPNTWIRRFELMWDSTSSDKDKIRAFELVLAPNSPAEDWFTALGNKATWRDIKTEFLSNWPPPKGSKVSRTSRKERMFSYKLEENEIGELMEYGKTKELSHIVWAKKVETEWKWLEDKNGDLIERVMENLPKVVLDSLGDPADLETDWHVLIETVKKIPLQTLKRKIADNITIRNLEDRVNALTSSSSTTNSQASRQYNTPNRFSATYYNPQTPQHHNTPTPTSAVYVTPARREPQTPQRTPTNAPPTPSSMSTPNRDNSLPTFYGQSPDTPSPAGRRFGNSQQSAWAAKSNSRTYPNTNEGVRRYEEDIVQWEMSSGNDVQMKFIYPQLPLTPGTVALGSGECFRCGYLGHATFDNQCNLPDETLNTTRRLREKAWRNYINQCLNRTGNRLPRDTNTTPQTAGIALITTDENTEDTVEYDTNFYNLDIMPSVEWIQGKARESRA